MTTEINPGDVVWVEGGGKVRPGVVIRILPETHVADGAAPTTNMDPGPRILVLWGTGTYRPEKMPVVIELRTAGGTALGIDKPTCFYAGNMTLCRAGAAQRTNRRCPPELLLRLSALIGL